MTKVMMEICRRLSVVLLLLACAAGAAELGASLQLEGRMACQRGAAWLIARQAADGSWQQDPALSAQAALALVAVADDLPTAHVARSQAIAYVQESLAQVASSSPPAGALAAVLRLFLRENIAVPPEIVTRLYTQVTADETPAMDAMLILETLLLLQRSAVAVRPGATEGQGQETVRLAELLHAKIIAGGDDAELVGEQLAARMAMGDATAGAAQQRLKELRGAAGSVRFTELYWLARVLYAQVDAEATWRTTLLIMLLEKQRGDGGWGGNEDSPAQRLADSAWALQTLSVLLAEALPPGK